MMKREEILDRIIEEQQKIIENLKQSVERYKTASDLDEDDTSDPDDLARQTEAKDMQLRFQKMLNEAKQIMNFLISEKKETHNGAEIGSVIETDKNYLFVGASIPAFKLNGKDIICFSDSAPVYAKIKDKKAGEKFEIGDKSYEIVSVS